MTANRLLPAAVLLLVVILLISLASHPPGTADALPATRAWAPVVVRADAAPGLAGLPGERLAVWAWRDSGWRLIPWQVDEVDSGHYTTRGDGVFNGQDELVMMLDDLGEPTDHLPPGAVVAFVVRVADPHAPDASPRYAVVARMSDPAPAAPAAYVTYDPLGRRVVTDRYAARLDSDRPILAALALNGSGVNLIDRSKVRLLLDVCFGSCLILTDEQIELAPLAPSHVGPIRVVLSPDGGFAYRDWLRLPIRARLDGQSNRVLQAWLALDMGEAATGAVYRDANTPGGVTIDGRADDVAALPVSPWSQVDHATGRLVTMFRIASPGDRRLTRYVDHGATLLEDTGDHIALGEHGLTVDEPTGPTLDSEMALWALPAETNLDGAALAAQSDTPLVVTVAPIGLTPRLYLPWLVRAPRFGATGRRRGRWRSWAR